MPSLDSNCVSSCMTCCRYSMKQLHSKSFYPFYNHQTEFLEPAVISVWKHKQLQLWLSVHHKILLLLSKISTAVHKQTLAKSGCCVIQDGGGSLSSSATIFLPPCSTVTPSLWPQADAYLAHIHQSNFMLNELV